MRLLAQGSVTSLALIATAVADGAARYPTSDELDVITRDVCIIGGGSSGTYAAINLQQMGHSVIILESKERLGGHTITYVEPHSGITIDYGVQRFQNDAILRSYFDSLGVSFEFAPRTKHQRFDFQAGKPLDPVDEVQARRAVSELLRIQGGYPGLDKGFDLPEPVPEDLYISFGDFVKKHKLEAVVEDVAGFAQDLGNFWDYPAVYSLKYFGPGVIDGVKHHFYRVGHGNNSAIYESATEILGKDVLLNSHVISMDRSTRRDLVFVEVVTPAGLKLIRAKKLLVTIPPLLSSLGSFDLDPSERELFGQFNSSIFHTMLAKIPGFPGNTSFLNRDAARDSQLPQLPTIYSIAPTVHPDFFVVHYGSEVAMSEAQVRVESIKGIKKVCAINKVIEEPEIIRYAAHTPYGLRVSSETVSENFYKHLNALQGIRNTFYTGAAFHTHNSVQIWKFTEKLLRHHFVESVFEEPIALPIGLTQQQVI